MEPLTLAALFTAAGAVAAAVLVRQLVQLVKHVLPALDARISGALQAFVAAAVLYILAYVAVGPFTPEGVFLAFLSWLGCAVGAVGIDATLGHVTGSTERELAAAFDRGFESASWAVEYDDPLLETADAGTD